MTEHLAPRTVTDSTQGTGVLPRALLWDMDGTLIDTEPYWIGAEQALMARFGVDWTEADGARLVGMALTDAAKILQVEGADLPAEEISAELTASVGEGLARRIPWQPGARELLDAVRAAGIPCALVTMSYAALAARMVEAVGPGVFDVVVTGEDVEQGKPHPEPYLRAAELMGVPIEDCVAFEDSPPGITSALASGAATVAVRALLPIPARDGLSRVPSLETVDLDVICRAVAGEVVDLMDGRD